MAQRVTRKEHVYLLSALLIATLAGNAVSQVIHIQPPPGPIGWFGATIASLADVDGDGFGDFAIRWQGGFPNDPRFGRVLIYSGRTQQVIRMLASPQVRSGFEFGVSFEGLPDVNGDGRADIVVGEVGQTIGSVGFAYLFSGATEEVLYTESSGIPYAGAGYGGRVAAVPDVDGDGVADFLVDAADPPPLYEGRAYVYSGATGQLIWALASPQPESNGAFGAWMGAPDMDGDGRGEILATSMVTVTPGQPRQQFLYFFSGATGQSYIQEPFVANAMASVPDVDGDGVPDLVIGNSGVNSATGMVSVVSGATGQVLYTLQSPSAPGVHSQFGRSVAGVPDVDGDGRGDFLVGAVTERHQVIGIYSGAAYLVSGATGTILKRFDSPNPQDGGFFGYNVASVSDSNGDGVPEVLVSAAYEGVQGTYGQVYLFLSCTADYDHSGAVNSQDFFEFLIDFFSASPRADFNHSGAIDSQDFFDFVSAFFAGCD